jgi:hypothetical protein
VAFIDVFNGDADGICALLQLRLAEPRDSRLVTGVKRDIGLVAKAGIGPGDDVTILDISMEKNIEALSAALQLGARCFYVDHHYAGDIPEHSGLRALINTASDICTSLLVNQHLRGDFIEWAVVGAFGDNLHHSAHTIAGPLSLDEQQLNALSRLGLYVNYNGYGARPEDLHFTPENLYHLLSQYRSPLQFIADDKDSFGRLEAGYRQDMAQAQSLAPEFEDAAVAVFILPEADWARRVSGVYSNDLANGFPARAHAVLTRKSSGNFLVSVRAPLDNKTGADDLCRQFPTGGGRKAAAGINDLPAESLAGFIDAFGQYYR